MGNASMGNASIGKGIDFGLGDIGKIDLGLGDIDASAGEILAGAGAGATAGLGAGIGVGIADGTAGAAYDWLRGQGGDITEGKGEDFGSGFGSGGIDFGNLIPRGSIGDIPVPTDISGAFADAADTSRDVDEKQTDEKRQEETKGVEEEDDDDGEEEDDDKEPPKFPPGFNIPAVEKDDDTDGGSVPTPTFIIRPISLSMLRAKKRMSSGDVNPDDFETVEQSVADANAISIIQDDMRPDTNNTQPESIHDHTIQYHLTTDYKEPRWLKSDHPISKPRQIPYIPVEQSVFKSVRPDASYEEHLISGF